MTKPTKWLCAQRRLRSAWASAQSDKTEPLLCAHWVTKDPSFLRADSEDSDQTGRMPRLIWIFAGRIVVLLVFSWGGSNLEARPFVETFSVQNRARKWMYTWWHVAPKSRERIRISYNAPRTKCFKLVVISALLWQLASVMLNNHPSFHL